MSQHNSKEKKIKGQSKICQWGNDGINKEDHKVQNLFEAQHMSD
jgi:hypothetical protein